MNNPQIYEKIVKCENTPSRTVAKICAIAGYICFDLAWIWGIIESGFNIGVIALAIITTAIIINITWKLFMLEYEYSFVGSSFSVAKIYAKSRRRTVAEAEIKDALFVAPATEENLARIAHYEISHTLYAISSDKAENVWFALFDEKEGKKRTCVYFEADDKTVSIFRKYNPHATARTLLTK